MANRGPGLGWPEDQVFCWCTKSDLNTGNFQFSAAKIQNCFSEDVKKTSSFKNIPIQAKHVISFPFTATECLLSCL